MKRSVLNLNKIFLLLIVITSFSFGLSCKVWAQDDAAQEDVFVPTSAWLVGPSSLLAGVQARENGLYLPCVMLNQYDNGFVFRFSGTDTDVLTMGIDFRQAAFDPGESYRISVGIDAAFEREMPGHAHDEGTLIVNLSGVDDFRAMLQTGETLRLKVGGVGLDFALLGLGDALTRLGACYSAQGTAQKTPSQETPSQERGAVLQGDARAQEQDVAEGDGALLDFSKVRASEISPDFRARVAPEGVPEQDDVPDGAGEKEADVTVAVEGEAENVVPSPGLSRDQILSDLLQKAEDKMKAPIMKGVPAVRPAAVSGEAPDVAAVPVSVPPLPPLLLDESEAVFVEPASPPEPVMHTLSVAPAVEKTAGGAVSSDVDGGSAPENDSSALTTTGPVLDGRSFVAPRRVSPAVFGEPAP